MVELTYLPNGARLTRLCHDLELCEIDDQPPARVDTASLSHQDMVQTQNAEVVHDLQETYSSQHSTQLPYINISQAGTEGPPVSAEICDRPLESGLKTPGPLVRASVGITDEADSGTVSSAQPQRNPTYRLSS